MRSKTLIPYFAAAISFVIGVSATRAAEMNAPVDARSSSPAADVAGPQFVTVEARPQSPTGGAGETEAGTPKPLRLTLKDPEERFAQAPMPIASHDVHYDDTPQGIPAHVTTMGFVQKF